MAAVWGSRPVERALRRRRGARGGARRRRATRAPGPPAPHGHTPARNSVRIRTRLYAAFTKVKIQSTVARPR